MKNSLLVLALFCYCFTGKAQETTIAERSPFVIGETLEFRSRILKEDRRVNIYLPASYATDSLQRYPVIYLLDGAREEDFIHVVGLVQFGNFPWIDMLPESIVVGISNVDRERDFTFPTTSKEDKKDLPTSGGSAKFIRFLHQELQPLIEDNYRTGARKTIIGQSLGGLMATEILFTAPDLFDNYIIVSPSLWWDNESLLKVRPRQSAFPKSIYIGVGKEGKVMESVARALYEKIKAQKAENVDLYFNFFEQLSHADTLHLAVYSAFQKIFSPKE